MSRDLDVFGQESEVLRPEDIVAALDARGLRAEWRIDPFAASLGRAARNRPWRAAQLVLAAEDDGADSVQISNQGYDDTLAASITETYADQITAPIRETLDRLQITYRLSVGWLPDSSREKLFLNLADAVAELTNGIILDNTQNRIYDREAFRSEHSAHLGGKSKPSGRTRRE